MEYKVSDKIQKKFDTLTKDKGAESPSVYGR